MKNFIKIIMLLSFVMTSIEAQCEDFSFLKSRTENEFNQKRKNLKGHVFSVVTYGAKTKKEFGEQSADKYYFIDSLLFDEKGRITEEFYYQDAELHRNIYTYDGADCKIMIQYFHSNEWENLRELLYKREFDDMGRIISETMYQNGEPKTRINYSYTPNGYKVEYYKSLTGSPVKYEIKNNTYTHNSLFGTETYKLNNDEKPILYNGAANGTKFNYIWKYNEYGDLLEFKKQSSSPFPGMGTESYEYKYDNNGNWISRVKTDKYGEKTWYKRNIIYKTPQEFNQYYIDKLAREKAIRDSLYALGVSRIEENCNNFVNGILESRGYNAARTVEKFGYNLPFEQKVSNVSTNADWSYNMTMASGVELKNLSFNLLKNQGPNCFITPDGKTALILSRTKSYPFLGVVNFNIDVEVIRHNANKLANAMKSDSIAMIEMGENLSSDTLWQKNYAKLIELSDQNDNGINEINYIPFDVAAEMVYPKGFVENDNLREQFRKCADYILIKNAIEHIEFDNKGKPLALKIKKWEQTDSNNYQFVFKDKEPSRIFSFDYTRIEDPYNHFLGQEFIMNCLRKGIEIVGLSRDKKIVLVPTVYSSKNKIITFLIEIDNRGEYVASYYFERKI